MAFRRATGIKAYVGARSMTATLLALVISLFAAATASAHGSPTKRTAAAALSALAARGVVLHPGVGYEAGGSPLVRELQRFLSAAGYPTGPIDGRYGPLTTRAVMGYQSDFGLRVDGIAGRATLTSARGHGELLRRGAGYELGGSPIVHHLQRLLAAVGDSPGPFDGRFGPRTEAAVRRFQARDGLRVTGIVGPRELADLRSRAATRAAQHGKHTAAARHSNSGRSTGAGSAPATTPAPTATTPTSSAPATTPAPTATTPTSSAPATTPAPTATTPTSSAPATTPTPAPAAHTSAKTQGAGHSAGSIGIVWILGLIVLVAGLGVGLVRYLRRRRDDGPMAAHQFDPVAPVQPQAATVLDEAADNGVAAIGQNTPSSADLSADDAGVRDENGHVERPENTGDITPAPIDINAAFDLGVLLEEQKDVAGAEAAYRRADERGHAAAASNLGVLLEAGGDRAGAEAAYRRADERGEANGAFNLGVLLEGSEDLTGAEAAYRRADERGHAAAASNLGVLLEGNGDRAGAEAAYRRADERDEAERRIQPRCASRGEQRPGRRRGRLSARRAIGRRESGATRGRRDPRSRRRRRAVGGRPRRRGKGRCVGPASSIGLGRWVARRSSTTRRDSTAARPGRCRWRQPGTAPPTRTSATVR